MRRRTWRDYKLASMDYFNEIWQLCTQALLISQNPQTFNVMRVFIFLASLFLSTHLFSNNIEVTNISLTGQDVGLSTINIQFDLSWENSWRVSSGPANYDAAWVFAKFRVSGGQWNHVNINYVDGTNDGHGAPTGSTISTVSGGTGCYIYRTTDGSGDVDYSGVKLLWDYGAEGLSDDALIEIKVMAIEMVYVPTGNFHIGAGPDSAEVNRFYLYPFGNPVTISSEGAINVGTINGSLYYQDSPGNGGDQLGPIPAAFPKGHAAFYSMKYELSQSQWIAFFNTLTPDQKLNHDLTDVFHKGTDAEVGRNGIAWESGTATTTLPDVPLNYVKWADLGAYFDWAGLRPLTELEYEKSCRGTLPARPGEYAWGNAEFPENGPVYTFVNLGGPFELISNPQAETPGVGALATLSGFGGPARCGIYAASAINPSRIESGGSYYGIMELSGNLYERVVSVGNPNNRAFTGEHGDGELNASGEHNVANWPASPGPSAYKGASYINGREFHRVSDRYDAANGSDIVNSRIGCRGGRTE